MNYVFNSYLIYLNRSKINIWYPLIKYISLFPSLYIKQKHWLSTKRFKIKILWLFNQKGIAIVSNKYVGIISLINNRFELFV